MTKTKIKYIIVMAVILLTMLLIGSFMDYDISDSMYIGSDSLLAVLGGLLGKLPAFLMLGIAFAILMNYVRTHGESYKRPVFILLNLAYVVAMLLSFVLAFYSAFEEITEEAKFIGIVLGGLSTIIAIIVVSAKSFSHIEELKKWAILTIIAIVVLILSTLLLKTVWGRQRFSDVMGNDARFTPWYIPQGVTGGHSLPSGHTGLWGALYMVLPLFAILGYKGEGITFVAILVTQLFIGIFRVIGGHHYLSDITIAMALSFIISMVTIKIGYKDDYSNSTLGERNIFRYI